MNLEKIRAKLDIIDESLIKLLGKRFRMTQEIGLIKKHQKLLPRDPQREKRQMDRITLLAEKQGVDPSFAQKLLRLIIDEVVKNHQKIIE